MSDPFPETFMLYIGSGFDVRPIQRYSHRFGTFIYVDGLPSSFNRNNILTKQFVVERMQRTVRHDGCGIRWVSSTNARDRTTCDVMQVGRSTVYYFFDTLDTEMGENKFLANLLPRVEALYIKGFSPKLYWKLPNLKEVISTRICSPSLNPANWAFDFRGLRHSVVEDYDTDSKGRLSFLGDCDRCSHTILIGGLSTVI